MQRLGLTQLVCLCLALSGGLEAATPSASPVPAGSRVKELSLEECLRLALEHNYDIQYARYQPKISETLLSGAYSYYDPTLNASAQQIKSTQRGFFDPTTGVQAPDTIATVDQYSTGLRGQLPTGLQYDIGWDVTFNRGQRDFFGLPGNFANYNVDLGIRMTQPLLRNFWIDSGRAQILINRKDLKISRYDLLFQIMRTVLAVQQGYYDLIAARDNVRVQEIAVELAERLVAENKKKVQVGTLAPLDEKQAEAQAASSRAALITARAQVKVAENNLKNIITDHYEQWQALTLRPAQKLLAIPEDFSLAQSWFNALTLRPDFNRLKTQLERQGILVRLRHNQVFPSLNLVGSYGRSGIDQAQPLRGRASLNEAFSQVWNGDNPRYSFGAVFSIPLENRGARKNYQAAKQQLEQMEIQIRQLHQQIIVEVDNAIKLAQAAYESVQATRQAREYAEIALQAEQKKLDNGKSTSFNVLQFQRDLTAARSQEINALADYNKALAELYFREGTILQKNGITVKVK